MRPSICQIFRKKNQDTQKSTTAQQQIYAQEVKDFLSHFTKQNRFPTESL